MIINRIFLTLLFLATIPSSVSAQQDAAFVPSRYTELPLGAIRPKGWLLNQLTIMKNGTTGHLDEVYDKVKNDNGWLGGNGDGWEETPYWLDGAVPLAYLLQDSALIQKVLRYVNWTLDNQRHSGYFGPVTKWEKETGRQVAAENCDVGEDWWPKMIMLKTLQQYYTATNDRRVIPFMRRYFDYQLKTIQKCRLGKWTEWSQSRGADNMLVAQWLYGITKDPSLLKLSAIIKTQAFPWSDWYLGRDWVINAAAQQNEQAWMSRHGVNVAMGIKDPAVNYQRTGDKKYLKALEVGFNDLLTLHGLPFGMFSSDEDLHANDPTQGTELCAIVESMFSLEHAIAVTGDIDYMDALERMTFNALPSQTTDDYNNKQYFQIANQVNIAKGVFNFSLPFGREMNNVLGMRSGYTCCLANMHQGWTKFTTHLWYGTQDNGVAALHYSPNQLRIKLGNTKKEVIIDEITTYPFSNEIRFQVTAAAPVSFPFHLRIPSWCKAAEIKLNGNPLRKEAGGKIVVVNRQWRNGDVLTLTLPMEVRTSNWGSNSRAVERGPLVYALKLEEQWQKGFDEKEGEYFTVSAKGDWNYGLLDSVIRHPSKAVKVHEGKAVSPDFVWNLRNAPIELKTYGKKIPGWQLVNNVAYQPITTREGFYQGKVDDEVHEISLVPIGCTKVRIVAFPVVR